MHSDVAHSQVIIYQTISAIHIHTLQHYITLHYITLHTCASDTAPLYYISVLASGLGAGVEKAVMIT